VTAPAAPVPCRFAPLFGTGRRVLPTVGSPSYELVLNGDAHLARALYDAATWVDRVHLAATAIAPHPISTGAST
jgi:hypothetical protein